VFEGAAYLSRGAGFFLRRPSLWRYAILPILLNVLIFAGLAALTIAYLPRGLDAILPNPEGWWNALYWPAVVVAWLLTAIAFLVAFYLTATIVASPFYGRLARRTLSLLRGAPVDAPGGFWADFMLPILNTLRRLGLLLVLLPLSLVPVVGVVFAAIATSFFFALEFLDYSLDSVTPPLHFADRRRYAWTHRWPALGFGFAVTLGMCVPVIDLVVMPWAVVGAAIFFHERPEGVAPVTIGDATPRDGRNP
jgi:CysZ protein